MNWAWIKHCPWLDTRARFVAAAPAAGTLLYLGSSDGETLGHMAELRPDLRQRPVLPHGFRQFALLNLAFECVGHGPPDLEGRIRDAARRKGLQINSQLLHLGKIVGKETGKENR